MMEQFWLYRRLIELWIRALAGNDAVTVFKILDELTEDWNTHLRLGRVLLMFYMNL